MKLKEYKNTEEMWNAHRAKLQEINDTIENSFTKTYVDFAEEYDIDLTKPEYVSESELSARERGIYDYSADYYTEQANLSARAYQYDEDSTFKIGNNVQGGI